MKIKKNNAPSLVDFSKFGPIQVVVESSSREDFEHASRKFKSIFQKERVIGQIKDKSAYEKPSAKKRRKKREAHKRRLMAEYRQKLIDSGEWEKRQKKRFRDQLQKKEQRAKGSLDV